MQWIHQLGGSTVAIDTAPFIYFIERHPIYISAVRAFFDAMDQGEFEGIASAITLTEVLVLPYRSNNMNLVHRYNQILQHSNHLTLIPVSNPIAEEAARLRASHRYKTPDSIHMATAKIAGAKSFLTNDSELGSPAGLSIVALDSVITPRTAL